MNKIKKFLPLVLLLLAGAGCCCSRSYPADQAKFTGKAKPLKIGWSKRSLNIEGPVYISGQMHVRYSLGQFSPVLANVLVLENGDDAVIFISADIISIPPELLTKVQSLLRKEMPGIPVEKIIINATHTHAGPSPRNLPVFPHKSKIIAGEKLRTFMARRVADAVKEAWSKRAPGSISYGYGFAVTGHNRRSTYLDDIGLRKGNSPGIAMNGHARMYGPTNDSMFAGYENGIDAFINLLYTFDAKGKLTGAVVNVPCPSQTLESAWVLHASFWHHVREKLSKKYGDIGVIGQSAAAGDLSPRQLHYREAEKRRYAMKYADKIAAYLKSPMASPGRTPEEIKKLNANSYEVIELMRSEDIANRICTAFDEVLSWAAKEKLADPVLRHQVKDINISKRLFPKALVDQERKTHTMLMKQKFVKAPEIEMLIQNSRLAASRRRIGGVLKRFETQKKEKTMKTRVHTVRIGDIAFATNRFELYMDYMHRIQARSPFMQTFVVQLTGEPFGSGSYLATERALKNKGYSATPYCNQASPRGGQDLVEATLKMLNNLR